MVDKGRLQIEFGGLVQRDDSGNARTRRTTTPTLLRLGLTDTLELRLATDGRMRTRETTMATAATVHERGWADSSVGFKWKTHEGNPDTGTPSIGWIFEAQLPSGSRAFRGRGVRPGVLGAVQFALTDDLDFATTVGVRYDNDAAAGRFWSGTVGAGIVKDLTDRFKLQMEVVGLQIAHKRYGGSVIVGDVSLLYLLSNTIQVDALIGRGLTSESPKYVVTAGISARF